jgi:hypothetical protein
LEYNANMKNKTKLVYLSGIMQGATKKEIFGWRNRAIALLNNKCWFPNVLKYSEVTPKEVVEGDKKAIDKSSVLLVYFIRASVGTSMEVIYTYYRNLRKKEKNRIKIVVVNETGRELSPWMVYHSYVVFTSLKKACKYINNLD